MDSLSDKHIKSMTILIMALILLLFPSVAETPTIWSLSWPQVIMQAGGTKWVMHEPGGTILKEIME